ncbi:hypothetical protein F66182_9609 [Fusarium sp. NRRL 66182]|nr:hypothetical protein F66182_9609 [Fusarium sp. NRRL 66182]
MISKDTRDENKAVQIYAPCIVFFVLTPAFIACRFWSRLARRTGLGWDDWIILLSFAVMMVSCHYGFGQHVSNLTRRDKLMALKLFYIAQILYKLTINLTKISILLLYLRIFVQPWFRACCYALMGLITCYMSAAAASSIWQCNPARGAWDTSVQPTCLSLTRNWHANAGFSIATHVLILLLPMQPVWKSKLSVTHRRALMMVLTIGGGVVIVMSTVRTTTLEFSAKSPDTTYDIASTLWTIVEQNLAIICTCLPMCRIPLTILFPPWFPGSKVSTCGGSQLTDRPRGQPGAWRPYAGPRNAQGTTQSFVLLSEESSGELMLDSLDRTGTLPTLVSDAGVIRKTVEYGVTYDTNPAANT